MPRAFKISEASKLHRWWTYESFGGGPFVRNDWWHPDRGMFQDDAAAYASKFSGTFIRKEITHRNLIILWPYEFYRPHILRETDVRLRTRVAQACLRKYHREELPFPPASMARQLLGCSLSDAVVHLESLMPRGMNWSSRGLWHIDHIRPLCSFDLRRLDHAKAACHYTNLQPLWRRENLSKGGRTDKWVATNAAHS